MRRFGKIISLVAVIGVLVHAGLLVRHNGVMLDAAFQQLALSFAGGVICHDGGEGAQPGSGVPAKPPTCPICVNATASAAILPPLVALKAVAPAPSLRIASVSQRLGQPQPDLRPPSRAPPQAI